MCVWIFTWFVSSNERQWFLCIKATAADELLRWQWFRHKKVTKVNLRLYEALQQSQWIYMFWQAIKKGCRILAQLGCRIGNTLNKEVFEQKACLNLFPEKGFGVWDLITMWWLGVVKELLRDNLTINFHVISLQLLNLHLVVVPVVCVYEFLMDRLALYREASWH